MKLKMVVVDLELSRRAKRIAAAALVPVLVIAGGAVAYAGMLHTWKDGDPLSAGDLNGNFSTLDGRVTTLEGKNPPLAYSAASTGSVLESSTWTTIPGLSINFKLAQSSLVQAIGDGVQRTFDTNPATTCHASYRFVVDGVPKGDAMGGQRTHVSTGAEWHQTWSIADFGTLAAGAHTIALQTSAVPGKASCYVCGEYDGTPAQYDGCTLNIVATPQ